MKRADRWQRLFQHRRGEFRAAWQSIEGRYKDKREALADFAATLKISHQAAVYALYISCGIRVCRVCGKEFPSNSPLLTWGEKSGSRGICRLCFNDSHTERHRRNSRDYDYMRRYRAAHGGKFMTDKERRAAALASGMTLEEYELALADVRVFPKHTQWRMRQF